MDYIVLDLEWNQSIRASGEQLKKLPFEIIEIGAIKLNEAMEMVGEFSRIIKPEVYSELNRVTGKLIHIHMSDLARGEPFYEVMSEFLEWCGEDVRYATWGSQDLGVLQSNMEYHNMTPMSDRPIAYYDVQKLFAIHSGDRRIRISLENAIDSLGVSKDIPFHRAFGDAFYTSKVLMNIYDRQLMKSISYDTYHPPHSKATEIRKVFADYAKHITKVYESKELLLENRDVSNTRCYLCRRPNKNKVEWFTKNGKHYYALSFCKNHGLMKSKIRIKRCEQGVYAVKTSRYVNNKEAKRLRDKYKSTLSDI